MPEEDDIVIDVRERWVVGIVSEFKWHKEAHSVRAGNGGGCDRPRPFRITSQIWAGFVLAKYRGSTVTSAQVSSGIGIMP